MDSLFEGGIIFGFFEARTEGEHIILFAITYCLIVIIAAAIAERLSSSKRDPEDHLKDHIE